MGETSSSSTLTQRLQAELEDVVGSLYGTFDSASIKERSLLLNLHHDEHEDYVVRGLRRLSAGFYVLDSSRPWLCYWIVHSLALLGRRVDDDLYNRTVDFLEHCQDPDGGYGGGPGQMPHLATTYAATCVLVTLGGTRALSSINRKKVLRFLLRMKDGCGGFRVHDDGEMDMRGSYTALAVAHLLNIMVPELVENIGDHIRSCQTYEGGIGGEPGSEAHGGYTFCGLAALALTNQTDVLDLPSLVNWVAFRQGNVEGGFQGRTHKLVDGCYSFWQAGCLRLLQQIPHHLWVQQTSLAAALSVRQYEDMSSEVDPVALDSPETHGFVESDSERRGGGNEMESSSDVSSEFSRSQSVVDLSPRVMNAYEGTRNQPSQLIFRALSLKTRISSMSELNKAGGDYDSPGRDVKGWKSDDDADYWDFDSITNQCIAAEKLFPMSEESLFTKMPLQSGKSVDIADLAEGSPSTHAEVSGSSSTSSSSKRNVDDVLDGPIFNTRALQAYILLCCQDLDGGLRDKPGKQCDFYHTCYCLSGLSVAQHSSAQRVGAPPPPIGVVGPYSNLVEATHALCNVRLDRYHEAQSFFKRAEDLSPS